MMKRALFIILLIACFTVSYGQKFLDEIHKEVKAKKNEKAIASSEAFKTFWEGGQLSAEHKKRFVELVVEFKKKNFQPIPHYVNNMDIIRMAVTNKGIAGSDLDSLFSMLKQVVAKVPKGKTLNSTYDILTRFMQSDTLYAGNKHTYAVQGGSFKVYFVSEQATVEYEEDEPKEKPKSEFATDDDFATDNSSDDAWGAWDEEKVADTWATTDEVDANESDQEINEDILFEESVYIPNPKGPVIEFTGVDLLLYSRSDSAVKLAGTNFTLQLQDGVAIGDTGVFNWSSVGLPEEVNAQFSKYMFNINVSVIEAEDVILNYPSKIKEPVKGIFNYSVESVLDTLKKKFPRFMSYKSNVVITDFGENIKYNGGFSLSGRNVHSSSVSGGKCNVEVSLDSAVIFRAVARDFAITDSTILGYPVKVVVYQGEDSISHPGVRLDYNRNSQDLRLYKNKSKFKSTPFQDSFHRVEILADAMQWNLNDTVIHFNNISAKNEVPAYFDSYENFQLKRYAQLQGLYPFHPLQMAMLYGEKVKKDKFYVDDLANAYKQKTGTVRSAMQGLMQAGYIDFDPKGGLIILKPKAKHYFEARKNTVDYDYFSIRSIDPEGANGTLNVKNNELKINGVDEFVISDSLNIKVYPKDRSLIIQKNRDFIVNGLITTNNYRFSGSDFKYNHGRYDIELVNIDSIEFYVDVRDSITGEVIDKKVLENKLTYSSGTLTLDSPTNKACRKRNPKYPHFNANKGASIFFNGKEVLNGAYDSSIYYKIPPFDVDSLSGDLSAISFEGTFITSGIFPDFEQKMDVQKDLSFGFKKDVPKEGWPIYNGKGKFFGSISMDSKGLRGNGRIEMMGTIINSTDFVFYPDSVNAIGERAFTTKSTQNGNSMASMTVDDYEMKWVVSKDSLALSSYSSPIFLYDSLAKLNGTVVISTTKGMIGKGMLETKGALTISDDIALKANNYIGRQAQFEILSDIQGKPALRSDMVRVDMSITDGKARFNPEEKGFASNEFPYMRYRTSIDDGVWDMNKRTVTMTMPEGGDLSKSYFYSTKKNQDSLVFNAVKAVYYMDSLKMHISGVPEIRVVDAQVIPAGGNVIIGENALMDTLHNAVVLLDTANHYHRLFEGEIKINSKNNFAGRATYQYVNFEKDTLEIKFNKFDLIEEKISKKKKDIHTQAKGEVKDEEMFMLAPKIQYKGIVVMESNKKNLDLDGFVKLNLEGQEGASEWIKYQRFDTLDEVRINLADAGSGVDANGDPIESDKFSGMLFSLGTNEMYSVLVGKKKSANDFAVFSAKNILTYDFASEEFEVSTEKRLHNESFEGNYIAYHEETQKYRYSGKYNFLEFEEADKGNLDLRFSGFGESSISDKTNNVEGAGYAYFNVPLVDKVGKHMLDAIRLLSMPQGIVDNDSLYVNVGNLQDDKSAQAYKKTMSKGYAPLYKQVKGMETGIGFSSLYLEWHAEKQAWYSVGQIGVANIGKNDISTYLNGYVEIKNGRTGPDVNVYLEASANVWCFFSYSQGALFASSSLEEFNTEVSGKSQQLKNEPKELYYFALAEQSDKARYIQRHVNDYLGGKSLMPRGVPTIKEVSTETVVEDEFSSSKKDKKAKNEQVDEVVEDEFVVKTADEIEEESGKKKKKDKKSKKEQVEEIVTDEVEQSEEFIQEEKKSKKDKVEEVKEETNSFQNIVNEAKEKPSETPKVETKPVTPVPVIKEEPKKEVAPVVKDAVKPVAPVEAPKVAPKPVEPIIQTPPAVKETPNVKEEVKPKEVEVVEEVIEEVSKKDKKKDKQQVEEVIEEVVEEVPVEEDSKKSKKDKKKKKDEVVEESAIESN